MMRGLLMRSGPVQGFRRTFALDDIKIRSDGTGRTVEAYAAVFGVEAEVSDFDGSGYLEDIDRRAFDRSIQQRGTRFQVLYNHGLNIYGEPAGEFSKPIGVPVEVRAESRGLLTVTRYLRTPLGDEILEAVREGALREQSFAGRVLRSSAPGPYKRGQRVTRLEIALKEYGPTPFPVYQDAAIVGVRSATQIADEISSLSAEERAELVRLLGTSSLELETLGTDPPATGEDSEPVGATTPPDQTIEIELALAKARLLAA